MKAAGRLIAAVLAAALASMLVAELKRYQGLRFLQSGETLVLASSDSVLPREQKAYLAAADQALTIARTKVADDPRPPYLLASVSAMRGDHTSAIAYLQQSLAIEERPETDLNLALNWMAAGNAEAAATDALRAVWLSPDLAEKLPAASRGPLLSTLRNLTHRLRQGDPDASPELTPLDAEARENHGKGPREDQQIQPR